MDESPYQLYADLLTEKDRPDLAQFDCGSSGFAGVRRGILGQSFFDLANASGNLGMLLACSLATFDQIAGTVAMTPAKSFPSN